MLSRIVALLIGTLALASLRGQYDGLTGPLQDAPVGQKLWAMALYFTNLTNLAVAALMFAVARRWVMGPRVGMALVVAVVMMGAVFHLLLAGLTDPVGPAWWANQGLHTAVPLAVCLWWLAFADTSVGRRDLIWALVWPAAYGLYALARGYGAGDWPYPFLNGDVLGPGRLAVNLAGLLGAFAVCGAGVIGLARSVRKPGLVQ